MSLRTVILNVPSGLNVIFAFFCCRASSRIQGVAKIRQDADAQAKITQCAQAGNPQSSRRFAKSRKKSSPLYRKVMEQINDKAWIKWEMVAQVPLPDSNWYGGGMVFGVWKVLLRLCIM